MPEHRKADKKGEYAKPFPLFDRKTTATMPTPFDRRSTPISMQDSTQSRRHFVKNTSLAGVASLAVLPSLQGQSAPSQKLRVGVMGLKRGMAHIRGFQAVPNVEIAYVCDVDSQRLAEGAALANKGQKKLF